MMNGWQPLAMCDAGINVCSGSIVGMGESREDRIDWVYELTQMPIPPQSIPC